MKKCPFCAEKIQDDAVKCKHCGEMISEKPRQELITGFWEHLGQKAKKNLDKFESNTENRKKQRQFGFWVDLRQRAIKELDKFEANSENRKKQRQINAEKRKQQQRKDNITGCSGCLVFLVLFVVIIVLLFAYRIAFFEFLTKILNL